MDYYKYLRPFWIKQVKGIEEFFKTHSIQDYDKCSEIALGMLVEGGMPATIQVQGFHYINYETRTGKKIKDMNSIIEVGGGYGCMCRLVKTLNDCPYTIIDIPVISKIQKYILRNDININYVTLDNLVDICDQDMFISMYALSESNADMIEYILEKKLFNAKNILMCFQKIDHEAFIFGKYMERFKNFGTIQEMDAETFYLIK